VSANSYYVNFSYGVERIDPFHPALFQKLRDFCSIIYS